VLGHPGSRRPPVRIVRRPWFIVLSTFAPLLMLADVAVAATPTKVLATSRNEFDGTAEDAISRTPRADRGTPEGSTSI
jgi:hypothetical protein